LISVDYSRGYIILIPEHDNISELGLIFKNEKDIEYEFIKDEKLYYNFFKVPVKHVNLLNKKLMPLKNKLELTSNFKVWRDGYKSSQSKTIIQCGVIRSYIKSSEKIPHKEIEEATRYFFKAAKFHPKYKEGKWDGYINLYKRWEHSFPTGLLLDVEKVLIKNKIKYEVEYTYDRTPEKQFNWEICDGIIPDPDQLEAVEKAVQGLRGTVKAPTGYGKTAILAKRLIVEHSVPALFVANKKSLLDDAAEEFLNGIKGLAGVEVIKDGYFGSTKMTPETKKVAPLSKPIVVATIQSLSARLKDERTREHLLDWLRNICKFVMVDECQAVGTKIWDEVLEECHAPYRIYLSATPRRTDSGVIKLIAGSGPILFTTTAEKQIEKGRLCELDIMYQVYDHKLYNEGDTDLKYDEIYKSCIIENEERNRDYIVNPALSMVKEGRHVLVLIQYIDHGHIIKNMFLEEGLTPEDVRFIWGETPDKLRKNSIKEFKKGEFKILIGSTIFDAGVNIPLISGVVLGGAGNSDITLIQRIGRGARNCKYEDILGYLPEFMKKNHNKKITRVYDIMDINTKFFHKQALNRYYNAKEEFGHDRVHLLGGDTSVLKRKTKINKINKDIDQASAQLKMLIEFSNK